MMALYLGYCRLRDRDPRCDEGHVVWFSKFILVHEMILGLGKLFALDFEQLKGEIHPNILDRNSNASLIIKLH